MNSKKIFTLIFITVILSIMVLIIACETKPIEPKYDNAFDPKNPATSGDPFHLSVGIGEGGVVLNWTKPNAQNLKSYVIYRNTNDSTSFTEVGTALGSVTQYVDKSAKNGYNYWYRIAAVNSDGYQTNVSNVTAINIKSTPLFVINSNDIYTPNVQVDLTILAATADSMKISNLSDLSDANWEPYVTSKNWTLPGGEGENRVYLKVIYNNGNESAITPDTIIVDETPPVAVFTISPDSGTTDETIFQIDPTGSNDNLCPSDSLIIRFDWENNGTYDTEWQPLLAFDNVFSIGGGDNKRVKMQVQDGAGWTADTAIHVFVNSPPQASFIFMEDSINYQKYYFDATSSGDYEDNNNIKYMWDFEGDGQWDTQYNTADSIISFTYPAGSDSVFPILSVMDQNNLVTEISDTIVVADTIVTDRDGNVYSVIKIGNQYWMNENLRVTSYRNGNTIAYRPDSTQWSNLTSGAYCNYNNDENNVAIYGRLYNWYAVNNINQIAPTGWHVPSDADWQTLVDYLGGAYEAGGKLKEVGTSHWNSPNTAATNSSLFFALPGGLRNSIAEFDSLGYTAWFWSSTAFSTDRAIYRLLNHDLSWILNDHAEKGNGFSIRCVKD